ncbi:MAG: RagB/SusD family nutrient uptake outer membrane protein [Muribaculaceae bacterium]|nr:RagB/SusD family nutrient uptake outer membrane protein [Muribaculaceae bacterium]
MKRNLIYFATSAILASIALGGCNDLDTKPDNYYVSTEEKSDAIAQNPELAKAGVVGISSTYNQYQAVYTNHIDFGWPSVMLGMDCIGPDLVSPNTGYNWFTTMGNYDMGNNNNYMNSLAWYHAYKIINSANAVISNVGEAESDDLKLYGAQGYANRAFAYFNLIQLFQTTYKGSETKPGVPLITPENADRVATEGCPRSSVQEVYDFILSDLDTAISYLTECGMGVDKIAETGAKRFVSLGTAYGLRARVNLVMNNWQAAADDAAKAISYSGATPYSIQEASVPAFNDPSAHNWMWCIYVEETDRVVTSWIINWPSHMGSLNYGYASVGAWRYISKTLYNDISDTDCRKGWWLDSNCQSTNLNANQAAVIVAYGAPAYTQVKFAPYKGELQTTTNATSIILMRVEEMHLIQAEATAMAGNATEGKRLLEEFVKTYRDPGYVCQAVSGADVQEAVWMQRRIELWGEGHCYFDLLRLNKGIDRRGGGWDSTWVYDIPAPLNPLLIPQREMDANPAIGSNNPTWSKPSAVDDF